MLHNVSPYSTAEEKDAARKLAITDIATRAIEERYNPLKQRKLMSIAVALLDKAQSGTTLTTEEEVLMQTTRDVNAWITSIRVAENTAIANGVLAKDFNP